MAFEIIYTVKNQKENEKVMKSYVIYGIEPRETVWSLLES